MKTKDRTETKHQEKPRKDKKETPEIFQGRTGRRSIQLPVYAKNETLNNEFTHPEKETC